jgi:hypothetical protein
MRPMSPHELDDSSPQARRVQLELLRAACRI